MKPSTTPAKKPSAPPPVTLRRMPDGSFRIYGLRYPNRIHLTKEMRPWRQEYDPVVQEVYFMSWDQHEADVYAVAHGLTILGPTTS